MNLVLLVVALLAVLTIGPQAEAAGGYTSAQASNGASVYVESCASSALVTAGDVVFMGEGATSS